MPRLSTSAARLANRLLRPAGVQLARARSQPRQLTLHRSTLRRFDFFSRMAVRVRGLPGEFVECGIAWGTSLAMLACLAEAQNRRIWGFDTFTGFPEPTDEDFAEGFDGSWRPAGGSWRRDLRPYSDANREAVESLLEAAGVDLTRVTLVQGPVEETAAEYRGGQVALLHVDVDLYAGHMAAFRHFWPIMPAGAVAVLHDVVRQPRPERAHKFPGANRAVQDFFGSMDIVTWDESTDYGYIVKA